jgi:hypothetical protein
MKRILASLFAAAAMTYAGSVSAQEPVKIGLILPMTGGQASTSKQIDDAVRLYMQQHGDTVAGYKIEIILKEDDTVPDNTKRLAQELIVNDKGASSPASASRRRRSPPPRSRPKPRCPRSRWRPAPRSSPSARSISCARASR